MGGTSRRGFCFSHYITLPLKSGRRASEQPGVKARGAGKGGRERVRGRCSFLFPPPFSLSSWKQPLTLLTSLPTDQESVLGFPVTKVATENFPPRTGFLSSEGCFNLPHSSRGRGLCNVIVSFPGSELFQSVCGC